MFFTIIFNLNIPQYFLITPMLKRETKWDHYTVYHKKLKMFFFFFLLLQPPRCLFSCRILESFFWLLTGILTIDVTNRLTFISYNLNLIFQGSEMLPKSARFLSVFLAQILLLQTNFPHPTGISKPLCFYVLTKNDHSR